MPRRDVIRPDYDPIIVTLDTPPEGIQREGQFGVDYQYIVNGDAGIMWLPKAGRDALLASGARKGDAVEITKAQRGRAISYVASVVRDEPAPPPPARPQAAPRAGEPQPSNAFGQKLTQSLQQQPRPAEPQQQPRPAEVHPITELLVNCLRSAIDAMADARSYASAKQLDLDGPSWEDVRAIALSVYINRAREAR